MIEHIFREPLTRPADFGVPPPQYSRTVRDGILIERNIAVAMRDGVSIYVDIFRPDCGRRVPPIIAWTPYGKHQNGAAIYATPGSDVTPDMVSDLATFEGPDPAYWVPHGYAIINADIRGAWNSPGDATFVSPKEAEDFHDLIEWAGIQEWSNGRVGASGVSYLAVSQWRVAATHPPHLAAINPWEGWTDTYRELARHGGIPDTSFWRNSIVSAWGTSDTRIEDLRAETDAHPFLDAFWESKAADLEAIETPAFVVACWADQGLHERGTLEGFRRIGSKDKFLVVHGGKKWAHYYTRANMDLLRIFFDHYLREEGPGPVDWPKVRLELRERYLVGESVGFDDWPIPGTRHVPLFLNAADGSLGLTAPDAAEQYTYNALGSGPGKHRAEFRHRFDTDTVLAGEMKLHVAMTPDAADDMDVFVGVYKLDRAGTHVPLCFYSFFDDGPVALGWLRASHRELDTGRSTPTRPVLAHKRQLPLAQGSVCSMDIEIWPSGTRFLAGEHLLLIIQGTDLHKYPCTVAPIFMRHEELVNIGNHSVHTGGPDPSYLLIPIVSEGEIKDGRE